MPSLRQAGLRRTRAVVALCRKRLGASRWGRVGRVLAGLCAAGFAVAVLALRFTDGAGAPLEGLVLEAARWVTWVAGVPLALAAAEDRAALDRREGIEVLAAARGVSPAALDSARALGAMNAIAAAIGVPLVTLAVLAAALADRVSVALQRAGLALGVLVFAVVAGVTLGGAGVASSRLGRARGRWLLVAVVVGPWALADLAGHGAWSIPGALDAVLDFVAGGARA
jgi:hypothetical protein